VGADRLGLGAREQVAVPRIGEQGENAFLCASLQRKVFATQTALAL
jgi:hypothetical protein